MTAARRPGEDSAYFQAIEELFIRLRGAPLLLSPTDWQIARRWQQAGIPLELVHETLEALFARRAEVQGPPARKVQSLRYCASAVEEAWERQRELAAGGERLAGRESLDVGKRVAQLAAALPPGLADRESWRGRIEVLAGESAERAEGELAVIDRELIESALVTSEPGDVAELEAKIVARLEATGRRLPADALRSTIDRLLRQAVRRRLGLPVLSLFSPEAE